MLAVSTVSTVQALAQDSQDFGNKNAQVLFSTSHQATPAYGGTIVLGTSNPPTQINPITTTHSVSMSLLDILFNRLVRVDEKGEIVPDLAKDWDISADGLTYTFFLRDDVLFHDQVPLTADDVVFTYQLLRDPKNNSPFARSYDNVEDISAITEYSVQIVLKKKNSNFIYRLVREVVPKHVFEGENINTGPFNFQPIGTGPFKFKAWDKETNEIHLLANEDYFEGRPYIDEICVKTFKDVNLLWSAFMRQEIDLVKFIDWDDYQLLTKDPAFRTYKVSEDYYYAVVYNLNDPVLSDSVVRQAVAHGVNKNSIMERVLGDGVESTGPFHPNSLAFNSDVSALEYNPTLAVRLLEENGWVDEDGDGIREKDGVSLVIKMLVFERRETNKKIATLLRQNLAEIGIALKIRLYDDYKKRDQIFKEDGSLQAWLRLLKGIGWTDEGGEAATYWYSRSNENGKSWIYYNENVEMAFEKINKTNLIQDRIKFYRQIHKEVYKDQPACFLFYPSSFHAVSSRVKNTDKYFTTIMPLYTMQGWYVQQN